MKFCFESILSIISRFSPIAIAFAVNVDAILAIMKSFNPAYLNFPLAHECQKYVENEI
jgi:hypothetical protein